MSIVPYIPAELIARDSADAPESGAKLWFRLFNTTTPVTVYQDPEGASPHANPVLSLADGSWPEIYWDNAIRTRVLKTGPNASNPNSPDWQVQDIGAKAGLLIDLSNVDATPEQGADFLDAIEGNAENIRFNLPGVGGLTTSVAARMGQTFSLLDFIPEAMHEGIADGTENALLTAYIQAAIDYVNGFWIGGFYGGGGGEIYAPPGVYRHGALIWKKGVSLRGAGKDHTIFQLMGSNITGIALAAAPGDVTVSMGVAWGHFRDIAFFSGETAPVVQVLWSAVGFSRWHCSNVYWGWGPGCTAISTEGALLASADGPTSWYNDFFGCHTEKLIAGAGGVGIIFGDYDLAKEQVTTWSFYGGSMRGQGSSSGTAVSIRGAASIKFYGVVFESVATAAILGSANPLLRVCQSIEFHGCYWEGCATNWKIHPGNIGTLFFGGYVTGGIIEDDGTYTTYHMQGLEVTHLGPDVIDRHEIVMADGADSLPTIRAVGAQLPGLRLQNSAGDVVSIVNNAATSASLNQIELRDDADAPLISLGAARATFPQTQLKLATVSVYTGAGTPEAAVTAPIGSLFLRTDGSTSTTLYVKTSGSGNSGWTAK